MKEINEAIAMVQARNNETASAYVQKIMDQLHPYFQKVLESEKQDESLMLWIYYRKWNDIRWHWYACWFDKACVTNTDTLTFREYFNQTVNLSLWELE